MLSRKIVIDWYKIYDSLDIAKRRIPLYSASSVKVGKDAICLAHSSDGFFAVTNKCPHQGTSLGDGEVSLKGEIICPWHKYSFDLKTGRDTCGIGEYVETYPVKTETDGLFIGIKKTAWKWF